jgi:hypothetical protein
VPYESKSPAAPLYEVEQYHIEDGKVTRISVLGDHLTDDGSAYRALNDNDGIDNEFSNTSTDNDKGFDYGSFEVSDGVVSGSKDGHFYFTYSNPDTDFNP